MKVVVGDRALYKRSLKIPRVPFPFFPLTGQLVYTIVLKSLSLNTIDLYYTRASRLPLDLPLPLGSALTLALLSCLPLPCHLVLP